MLAFARLTSSKVYLYEDFSGDWEDRWVVSDWKQDSGEAGRWEVSAGRFYADDEKSKGLRTMDDAKFYAISTRFPKFGNKGRTLVVQYSVKYDQDVVGSCAGGYLKLFPSTVDQQTLHGGADEDAYNLMFGPDVCGLDHKVHAIFHYGHEAKKLGGDEAGQVDKRIAAHTDTLTHVYTWIIRPDRTYEIKIDGGKARKGELLSDWDFLPPRRVRDPKASKPLDWVDEPKMDDPDDFKPDWWDKVPRKIKDKKARRPADWDDDVDGAWAPPMVDNPKYKGEWKRRRVENPDYRGEWKHPEIENPGFKDDPTIAKYSDFGVLALELWQLKGGTIFDNILLTDSEDEAERYLDDTYKAQREAEKRAKADFESEQRAREGDGRRRRRPGRRLAALRRRRGVRRGRRVHRAVRRRHPPRARRGHGELGVAGQPGAARRDEGRDVAEHGCEYVGRRVRLAAPGEPIGILERANRTKAVTKTLARLKFRVKVHGPILHAPAAPREASILEFDPRRSCPWAG